MIPTSPCVAYYSLLAAIFAQDRDAVLERKGLLAYAPKRLCPNCGQEMERFKKYCHACGQIPIACDYCGSVILRRRAHVLRRGLERQYCDLKCCRMNWKMRGMPKRRKWDWEAVWAEHVRTGHGMVVLSQQFGIPKSTVYKILHKQRERHPPTVDQLLKRCFPPTPARKEFVERLKPGALGAGGN